MMKRVYATKRNPKEANGRYKWYIALYENRKLVSYFQSYRKDGPVFCSPCEEDKLRSSGWIDHIKWDAEAALEILLSEGYNAKLVLVDTGIVDEDF